MKTFQKAQEIFNNQLKKSGDRQNISALSRYNLRNKFKIKSKLYKIYLYNKFCINKLKKIAIFKSYKKEFIFFLTKTFRLVNQFERYLNTKQSFKKFKMFFKEYSLIKKSYFQAIQKNHRLYNFRKQIKLFLINFKFLGFYYFFEKQVFYKMKMKKNLVVLKTEFKILYDNLKDYLKPNLKDKLETVLLKYKNLLHNFIINYKWSNKFLIEVGKRLGTCFQFYSLAFLIFLNKYLSYLFLNKTELLYADPQQIILSNPYIQSLPLLLKKCMYFINNFGDYISILYLTSFISPKNHQNFPKERLRDLGICACLLLMGFAIENLQTIINILAKTIVLLIDCIVLSFFIRGEKRAKLFTEYTKLYTGNPDIQSYSPRNYIFYQITNNSSIGRYEKFISEELRNFIYFTRSYITVPLYGIILIVLLYNCSYYAMYNKYPYIPMLTDMVNKLRPNSEKD